MSSVDGAVTTIKRYSWYVKASYDSAGVIRDVFDAIMFATSEAKELGVRVDCDDWLRVRPRDEDIEFYFEVSGS